MGFTVVYYLAFEKENLVAFLGFHIFYMMGMDTIYHVGFSIFFHLSLHPFCPLDFALFLEENVCYLLDLIFG